MEALALEQRDHPPDSPPPGNRIIVERRFRPAGAAIAAESRTPTPNTTKTLIALCAPLAGLQGPSSANRQNLVVLCRP